MPRVVVTSEDDSGRNTGFQDTKTGANMTRAQFVSKIESGAYQGYHVRKVHGLNTPCSNPDGSKGNNLD
jgi:hypothetical protein